MIILTNLVLIPVLVSYTRFDEICDVMRRYEGRDPAELLPPTLPDTPVSFEPNKDYVRRVLADQMNLRTDGIDYVDADDLPSDHRYFTYQDRVNAGGAPSEQVIDQTRAARGRDFRDETHGEHPVPELRPQPVS